MAAWWEVVCLEPCFPPFLRRGDVLVRVRLGRKGGWVRREGRGRRILAVMVVVVVVGMRRVRGGLARISEGALWLRFLELGARVPRASTFVSYLGLR